MSLNNILLVNSVNFLYVNGWLNNAGQYVNTATVSYVLTNAANTTIASGSLSYVSGSNGNYQGSLASNLPLVAGQSYLCTFTINDSGSITTEYKTFYAIQANPDVTPVVPAPVAAPSYNDASPVNRLAVIRSAISAIMTGAQEIFIGNVRYRRGDIKMLFEMEKYAIQAVGYANGQYGLSVAEIDNPDDTGAINMSL